MTKSFKIPNFLTSGFAMFAMFFGAGNVMYPINVGVQSYPETIYGILGLMVTGVVMPFACIMAYSLQDCDESKYFAGINKMTVTLMLSIIVILMGPLAAIPRCVHVSFGSIHQVFPDFPFVAFSAIYCTLMLFCTIYRSRIIEIIGKIMTPLLLISLSIIVIASFNIPASPDYSYPSIYLEQNKWDCFINGLVEGYSTMDLIAATFFAKIIYDYIKQNAKSSNLSILKQSSASCATGMFLHAVVYSVLAYLGYKYGNEMISLSPESLLPYVGDKIFGNIALLVVGSVILLACLSTSVALVQIFAEFFFINKFRIPFFKSQDALFKQATLITVILSFCCSLMGLDMITSIFVKILQVLYPALIALTIGNIIDYYLKARFRISSVAFWSCAVISIVVYGINHIDMM